MHITLTIMSVQLPVKENMLFNACEIRGATGVLAPLNGARGTATDIIEDDEGLFRYAVRFDQQQPTQYLTHVVRTVTSPEGLDIVPCGLVFKCAPSRPNPDQCLVCAKPSRFDFPDLNDSEAPMLHYCSPACRACHKHRLKRERNALKRQTENSMVSMFQELGVALTVTTVVFCCSACGKVPTGTEKLLNCGACKQVRYCDSTCQKKHWKAGHKSECCKLQNS